MIIGAGALDATLSLAQSYVDDAKRDLGRFPAAPWRLALEELADYSVSRTS